MPTTLRWRSFGRFGRWRRLGKDRRYHYTVAAGSADEVSAALDCAEAWGYVDGEATGRVQQLIDRERAMLYRLTH